MGVVDPGCGSESLSDLEEELIGSLLGTHHLRLTSQTNRSATQGVVVPRLLEEVAPGEVKPVCKRSSPGASSTASALPLLVPLASPHMVP